MSTTKLKLSGCPAYPLIYDWISCLGIPGKDGLNKSARKLWPA